MRIELRGLILCSLVLLTGMRDPFRPPDDRCAIGKLDRWRYQGAVRSVDAVGMVKDEQDRWHRVRQADRLPEGWRVLVVNETEMVVEVGEGCDPKEWRWQREGAKNETHRDSRPANDIQPERVERHAQTQAGDAGNR
ncbi:DUF2531 family protein [Enterobacteriaceae bacterium RIT714]|nr:DUF2531 family protein [Enterobacteriaceae bacterium RIT714]